MALVQAYGREAAERERFHAQNLAAFRAQMTSTRLRAGFGPLVELIELAGVLVVMAYGTVKLSDGALSLGGLLVFMAYLSKLFSPVRGLSRLTTGLFQASAAAERVVEFLDERPAVADPERPLPAGRRRGAVRFDDVRFTYPGGGAEALRGVDLEVGPGEVLALVGPSGAGKSTLARLLLRFADPSAGRVSLDGADLRAYALADLRANVAVVLQETLVFDSTVFENIAYGRPGATRAEVEAAARAADAHDFISELPDGYESRVGQRGRRLSGGQRQRIALARAMIRDAPVLLLDEPTTGLDAQTAQRILGPMRRLMAGRATIVIAHDLLTVRDATRIAVLDAGRVVDTGRHEELLGRCALYRELWAARGADVVALPVEAAS
jgi:ABC-type multidrug transport system fused ATPase/permease subunit